MATPSVFWPQGHNLNNLKVKDLKMMLYTKYISSGLMVSNKKIFENLFTNPVQPIRTV